MLPFGWWNDGRHILHWFIVLMLHFKQPKISVRSIESRDGSSQRDFHADWFRTRNYIFCVILALFIGKARRPSTDQHHTPLMLIFGTTRQCWLMCFPKSRAVVMFNVRVSEWCTLSSPKIFSSSVYLVLGEISYRFPFSCTLSLAPSFPLRPSLSRSAARVLHSVNHAGFHYR